MERRGPMLKCDFKAPLLKSHFGMGVFAVNLMHIFRTLFYRNTFGGLLLYPFECPV